MSKNIVFNWILIVYGYDKKKKFDNLFLGWFDVIEMYSLFLV